MNSVRELHDEAMVLAQEALFAREAGRLQEAEDFARHAFRLEEEAAKRIAKEPRSEPTRSILYKSAASLAYQANEFAVAQRLVFEGLSGYPPPSVEQDLRDLYDQLNFSRHLEVRGVVLTSGDVRIAPTPADSSTFRLHGVFDFADARNDDLVQRGGNNPLVQATSALPW